MKKMKKIMTLLITLAMVMSMAVPAFADDTPADTDVEMPIAPAPAELTKSQVKAITPKNVKAASYSYTKTKVTWDKIEGLDGYKVYRATSKSGKYSLVKTTTSANTLSYINTGRTTGKTYYYKVRGYKKIGRTTYYTKYSAVTSTYARPNKAKITKVYLPKDEHVKVTWNKVSGATGYQVYRKRTDKSTWKLFKSVSSKTTAVTDDMCRKVYIKGKSGAFYYDFSDLDHNWEYKIRAYKTVNGKKVYGLFSSVATLKPEWTIEEVYDEVWKYIESLEWPLYEAVPTYPEPNEDDEYIVPKKDGSTYYLQHVYGIYSINDGEDWTPLYTNPENGETTAPEGALYEPYTEKGSSWTPLWPIRINSYQKKQSVVRQLKEAFEASLGVGVRLDPKYWDPEFECWSGTEVFTFYYKKDGNGYKVWCLE